jgi:hypothetical protein
MGRGSTLAVVVLTMVEEGSSHAVGMAPPMVVGCMPGMAARDSEAVALLMVSELARASVEAAVVKAMAVIPWAETSPRANQAVRVAATIDRGTVMIVGVVVIQAIKGVALTMAIALVMAQISAGLRAIMVAEVVLSTGLELVQMMDCHEEELMRICFSKQFKLLLRQ